MFGGRYGEEEGEGGERERVIGNRVIGRGREREIEGGRKRERKRERERERGRGREREEIAFKGRDRMPRLFVNYFFICWFSYIYIIFNYINVIFILYNIHIISYLE